MPTNITHNVSAESASTGNTDAATLNGAILTGLVGNYVK
jgi:hypothetical protein